MNGGDERTTVVTRATETPVAGDERGIGALLADLREQLTALFRAESKLLRSELKEKAGEAKKGAVAVAIGAVAMLAALGAFVALAIIALALVLPLWVSALLVAVALAVVGGTALAAGAKELKRAGSAPERTVQTIKRAGQLAGEHT